jgi:pyruvate/2-oxoglutarate dehydrogenase complex dihydrolipoamide dehydrogenase (E3) component
VREFAAIRGITAPAPPVPGKSHQGLPRRLWRSGSAPGAAAAAAGVDSAGSVLHRGVMKRDSFDAVVVGTGQSGPALAAALAKSGQRVAVVERGKFGGTCVNTGCIPTKTLVASARAAWVVRNAGDFGVDVGGPVAVDMKRVNARMKKVSGESNRGVEKWLEGSDGITVVRGHARFAGPRALVVGERTLEAERIFLNVGARAIVPEELRAAGALTNVEMLELDELPEHLIVVGGGYVGLEFGQMFRRFGSAVTVLQRGERILDREDEDISASVHELLAGEGISIRTGAECQSAQRRGGGVAVRIACAGDDVVEGSHLLVAVGRRPNTDDLGAEQAGLQLDEKGYVQVDDTLATSVPGIWAIGDCNGRGAFTHTSYNDYEIVENQLLGDGRRRATDRIPCYAVYVDPPLGRIGMTEREARASGRKVLVGRRKMKAVGRAKERGETHGHLKILIDADSEQILGAAVHGIEGDEVVHGLLNLMYAKASYRVLAESVAIHPTVSELLPTTVQSLEPLG